MHDPVSLPAKAPTGRAILGPLQHPAPAVRAPRSSIQRSIGNRGVTQLGQSPDTEDAARIHLAAAVVIQIDVPGRSWFYVNVNESGYLWLVPARGGEGNTFLRIRGGAHQAWNGSGETVWEGGDPVAGGRYLWEQIVGHQKVKGILKPDK